MLVSTLPSGIQGWEDSFRTADRAGAQKQSEGVGDKEVPDLRSDDCSQEAAEKVLGGTEMCHQRPKPDLLATTYLRAEARTLQAGVFSQPVKPDGGKR